jgi:hypothetical protein
MQIRLNVEALDNGFVLYMDQGPSADDPLAQRGIKPLRHFEPTAEGVVRCIGETVAAAIINNASPR